METATMGQATRAVRLEKLGFKAAASELAILVKRKHNLMIAYENYRFVTPANIEKFNAALKKKTGKHLDDAWKQTYQVLAFTPIENYEKVPPEDVLQKLEMAQERKCFDNYEIAHIKEVKDPLLFGLVDGTANKFFIAQWDNDVSIDDLLKANEG